MTAKVLDPSVPAQPASAAADVRAAPRARIVRDFLLLVTVCISVGLSVGLGMMVAVFALF